MIPSKDFGGGDRELFEECDVTPDELFLWRVESMVAKTKIRKNTGYLPLNLKAACVLNTLSLG